MTDKNKKSTTAPETVAFAVHNLTASKGGIVTDMDDSSKEEEGETHHDGMTSTQSVGQHIQDHLGRKLKASYDELVRQPVPDKFQQLLDELQRREKQQ
jgi:Anti-sigma factor NepR